MGHGALRVPFKPACFVLLACLLSACATPQFDGLQQGDRQGLPERAEVPAVPFFAQEEYYCGPAALAMTLAWSGLDVTQQDLVPVVYTPGREGSLQTDMIAGARRYGRLAVPVTELRNLLGELAAGNPVLVFQNLAFDWFPQWHYAVATGYDLDAQTITLHSGTHERLVTPLPTFERTWARADHWALVVTAPGRLAASATEPDVIAAAAGLERMQRLDDAATAYDLAVRRWPDSHLGWMALGNARYGLKEYSRAETAYRRAAELKPDAPDAWNNLAVAVAHQGRTDEALELAQRAVQNGGARADTFRETLGEIRNMGQVRRRRH